MDHPVGQPVSEWLPERYRNVLDRISDLEAAGRHADADRVRRDAIRAYSRSWTLKTARRLDGLAAQALALLATPVKPPRRWLAWRVSPVVVPATTLPEASTAER